LEKGEVVPPFGKGGTGGILTTQLPDKNIEIPLNPPFPKGDLLHTTSLRSMPIGCIGSNI